MFERDNHKCVNCGRDGVDAHHIIERKLFSDGGYYIDNGVTLCPACHWEAEKTTLSCSELRKLANISTIVLPENFDLNKEYDKWGNVLKSGKLYEAGPLFNEENVQKIIGLKTIHDFYLMTKDKGW